MSRRQFAKNVVASVGTAALAVAGSAQEPEVKSIPADENDVRVKLIEKSRGKPFTDDQRKAVLKNIRNTDKQWAEGRKFEVPDTTEPAISFTPTPLTRGRSGR